MIFKHEYDNGCPIREDVDFVTHPVIDTGDIYLQ